jgi:H+/gluconate symporter-like permease
MWLVALLVMSIVFIVLATTKLKMHPFLALLLTAFGFGILSGMPLKDVVDSVNKGFGGTIGYIGIVILAGAIIGAFLEKSGGAYRLATSILKLTGSGRCLWPWDSWATSSLFRSSATQRSYCWRRSCGRWRARPGSPWRRPLSP